MLAWFKTHAAVRKYIYRLLTVGAAALVATKVIDEQAVTAWLPFVAVLLGFGMADANTTTDNDGEDG